MRVQVRTRQNAATPWKDSSKDNQNQIHQTYEFDPGSERTLAAGLTHASRTRTHLRVLLEWQTGE